MLIATSESSAFIEGFLGTPVATVADSSCWQSRTSRGSRGSVHDPFNVAERMMVNLLEDLL
jgi:hypothetical protein